MLTGGQQSAQSRSSQVPDPRRWAASQRLLPPSAGLNTLCRCGRMLANEYSSGQPSVAASGSEQKAHQVLPSIPEKYRFATPAPVFAHLIAA